MTGTLHAAATLARRNVLLLANPRFLSVIFVVPPVFFAGFAAVLHKPVVNFGMFFPSAIVVQVAMDSAISTAFFLAGDCRDGIVARLRSMPISRLPSRWRGSASTRPRSPCRRRWCCVAAS